MPLKKNKNDFMFSASQTTLTIRHSKVIAVCKKHISVHTDLQIVLLNIDSLYHQNRIVNNKKMNAMPRKFAIEIDFFLSYNNMEA